MRSKSTLESKLGRQSTAPSLVAAGPAPRRPRSRAAPPRVPAPGWPHLAARCPCASRLRPQGPRWACGARPCSGPPMPPGCRLHGVGSGSLNGRCGACPEDIFQIFRTLGTRTRSPSASRALARRRSAPLPRLLGAGPRRAAGLRGLAAVRFAAPRLRGSSCAEGTWRSSRANGRPQKRQVGSARGGWPGAVEGTRAF